MPTPRRPIKPTYRALRIKPRPPAKRSLMSYPLGWLKQEAFYRDIAMNVIAVGFVGLIAYLYALAAGYVRKPPMIIVISITLLVAMLLVVALAYWAIHTGQRILFRALWVFSVVLAVSFCVVWILVLLDFTRNHWWIVAVAALTLAANYVTIQMGNVLLKRAGRPTLQEELRNRRRIRQSRKSF